MTDIFEQKILCKKCDVKMKPCVVSKNGLELRAIKCPKCGSTVVHPADLNASEKYNGLKGKTFDVKLRIVGNSHAVSIPKELVEFINEQHRTMNDSHSRIKRQMDDMVRLCLEDFNRLSMNFGDFGAFGDDDDGDEPDEPEPEEPEPDEESGEEFKEARSRKRNYNLEDDR